MWAALHRMKRTTTALYLAVHVAACTSVEGGAVELSWKLRPASSALEDKFVDCNSGKPGTNPVTHIRLDWGVLEERGSETWPCTDSYGVTRFVLPPGEAYLHVRPLCGEELAADPRSYISPAPERRSVNLGDTVSLGAVELIVNVSYCGEQVCICSPTETM
jgi:hypothetical protein